VALALVVLGGAACGSGPSSPGVASLGSTTTTTAAAGTGASAGPFPKLQQAYQDSLAYAECIRAHGLTKFPDPVLSSHSLSQKNPYDGNSPAFKAANAACQHLLPNGGNPPSAAQIAAITARLLKFAQCMRSHGVPDFPDPKVSTSGGGISVQIGGPGIGDSAKFSSARAACQSYLPGA
jgi:hypothetical protein